MVMAVKSHFVTATGDSCLVVCLFIGLNDLDPRHLALFFEVVKQSDVVFQCRQVLALESLLEL